MALRKQITQQEPFSGPLYGEYWVITEIASNKKMNRTEVVLICYKDQESSKEDMPTEYYRIFLAFDGMDLGRPELYPLIKQDSRFIDAEDC